MATQSTASSPAAQTAGPTLPEKRVMVELSILELGRIREGSTARVALDEARTLAQHAEGWGFRRMWVAEHHNFRGCATAATALVISHIAAGTKTLRVGAGGIMLPNHAPYVIAEQFGTLDALYPGRIDLGLGRAPGTDQVTVRALRRDPAAADAFPNDVMELQAFLAPAAAGQRVQAVPGAGAQVPLWILGSSLFGAQLAAELGLPFGFASHFAPPMLDQAIAIYRRNFKPSEQLAEPYVLAGLNVTAAPSDAEARFLATTKQMGMVNLFRGSPGLLQPPIEDINTYWSPQEQLQATQMLECSVVGGPDTVRRGIEDFVARTYADELMILTDIFDAALRLRSFEIVSEVNQRIS